MIMSWRLSLSKTVIVSYGFELLSVKAFELLSVEAVARQ